MARKGRKASNAGKASRQHDVEAEAGGDSLLSKHSVDDVMAAAAEIEAEAVQEKESERSDKPSVSSGATVIAVDSGDRAVASTTTTTTTTAATFATMANTN